ncbi:hypothetical protein BT63DRAFT_466610 [Microthyrium microscopicum]|uniref:Uncharacterized protein n=1 Tax=Microthyrium microscopicum TaxID=703497 RepID=A0A6A6UL83_9PEZI|nr:hypothetical protein BT63DRAFT_466610 [Microthyrium microscopicum]
MEPQQKPDTKSFFDLPRFSDEERLGCMAFGFWMTVVFVAFWCKWNDPHSFLHDFKDEGFLWQLFACGNFLILALFFGPFVIVAGLAVPILIVGLILGAVVVSVWSIIYLFYLPVKFYQKTMRTVPENDRPSQVDDSKSDFELIGVNDLDPQALANHSRGKHD